VGIVDSLKPGLKNFFRKNLEYGFDATSRWELSKQVGGFILPAAVKVDRPGQERTFPSLLVTETGHLAVGGEFDGWEFASNLLRDPADIVIPRKRLIPVAKWDRDIEKWLPDNGKLPLAHRGIATILDPKRIAEAFIEVGVDSAKAIEPQLPSTALVELTPTVPEPLNYSHTDVS
jgi:hypothetical protein